MASQMTVAKFLSLNFQREGPGIRRKAASESPSRSGRGEGNYQTHYLRLPSFSFSVLDPLSRCAAAPLLHCLSSTIPAVTLDSIDCSGQLIRFDLLSVNRHHGMALHTLEVHSLHTR